MTTTKPFTIPKELVVKAVDVYLWQLGRNFVTESKEIQEKYPPIAPQPDIHENKKGWIVV